MFFKIRCQHGKWHDNKNNSGETNGNKSSDFYSLQPLFYFLLKRCYTHANPN